MDARLLEILVCPLCKSQLTHDRKAKKLICHIDKLAYPIRDGIPVMLVNEAEQIVEGTLVEPTPPDSSSAGTL